MNTVKAKLLRTNADPAIEVRGIKMMTEPDYLWRMIIDHCAEDYSPNELRKILEDCEVQIKKLGPDRTPMVFEEMVADLKKAMTARGISFEPPPPSVTIVFRMGRRVKRMIKSVKDFFNRLRKQIFGEKSRKGLSEKPLA